MSEARLKGIKAEEIALEYLQQHDLSLVKRNFYSRFGEIDLIMRDSDELVFVEVKLRKSGLDNALSSITWTKEQKLVRAAKYYLSKIGYDIACRFDVVVLKSATEINWFKNVVIL